MWSKLIFCIHIYISFLKAGLEKMRHEQKEQFHHNILQIIKSKISCTTEVTPVKKFDV